MKETGIVRKVDDLGRIVIPKSLRDKLEIEAGTALEIIYSDDMVCFRKQDVKDRISSLLKSVAENLKDSESLNYLTAEEISALESFIRLFTRKGM